MSHRTIEEARQWLREQNMSISEWARQNGFTAAEVYRVLKGQSKCLHGKQREVAIKLNIAVPK